MYYAPEKVHKSRRAALTISDQVYDGLEKEYMDLAKKLNESTRLVTDTVGFPFNRPCAKLVVEKLSQDMNDE